METTNNITISIKEHTSVAADLPIIQTITTETELLPDVASSDAKNTESTTENAIVIAKEKRQCNKKFSIKYFFQSLAYSMQWSQFKRQLTKEALSGMAKRHWPKAIGVGVGCLLIGGMTIGGDNSSGFNQYNTRGGSAAVASMVDFSATEMTVVSEQAKENYIARFAEVAKNEMKKYNIPASIILGLAILHSNYGASELAHTGNNHFHITCNDNHLAEGISGRGVHEGACYMHYQNAWTSFRANSLKLNEEHYKELKAIAGKDYKIWVSGLQKMGYEEALDLLPIIEQHSLYELD